MRVVSIGDLVIDYYYKNEKLLGINGGMTCHNIIANLAKFGFETSVFGVCGNDLQGEFATKSLEILKVDISNIKKINGIEQDVSMFLILKKKINYPLLQKKDVPFVKRKNGMITV